MMQTEEMQQIEVQESTSNVAMASVSKAAKKQYGRQMQTMSSPSELYFEDLLLGGDEEEIGGRLSDTPLSDEHIEIGEVQMEVVIEQEEPLKQKKQSSGRKSGRGAKK